jgi:hypothetical protein
VEEPVREPEIDAYAQGFAAAIIGSGDPDRWAAILADATLEAGLTEADFFRISQRVEKALTMKGIYVP